MEQSIDQSMLNMVRAFKGYGQDNEYPYQVSIKRSRSPASSDSLHTSEDSSTPSKRPKRESKFDLSYVASPRETRRLRADLLEARNTIRNLEHQIQKMHAVRKETQIMFDNETKLLKQQNEHNRQSVTELETQLQTIRKRESDLKQQLAAMTNKYNMVKVKKEEEIAELEQSLSEMKEESHIYDEEESSTVVSLSRQLAEAEMLRNTAEEDLIAHKGLIFELEKQLAEKNSCERELEKKDQALQAARQRIKELEYAKENFLESQEQAKSQAHKLAHYPELEREVEKLKAANLRLKDDVRNKMMLEEEVHNLKTKLINSRENDKKLAQLQAENNQNQMYLDEWRAVARAICEITGTDSTLPQRLRYEVERLQQQEISLTSTKLELESQLNAASYELKLVKNELDKANQLVSGMKATAEKRQELMNRLVKKVALVSRERDSYRLQLDSYEKDLTMTINNTAASQSQVYKERIDTLEEMLREYRQFNAKLESDLQNKNPDLYADLLPNKLEKAVKLEEDLERLKVENEMLRKKCDRLEEHLEGYIIGQDQFQGQAFHLANNPLAENLAQREKQVERIEQENEKLKRRVKNLEAGLEASNLGDSTMSIQEVKQLQEQLKNSETQKQRLKELFKSSMKEFREVMYMLFGYKVDKPTEDSLYKLTSMYAASPDDQLCFKVNSDGTLNFLETEFSNTLDHLVELHLRHQKSIPLFLGALTMELFNNCTLPTATIDLS